VRLSQVATQSQCIALDDFMGDREEIRHAPTRQPMVGQLDQGRGAVTHQGQPPGPEALEPLIHQRLPRGIGAIVRHRFQHKRACREVHADQDHPFEERFIHGPHNLAHLPTGAPVLLPGCRGLQPRSLQRRHHTAQGCGRTPHLGLQRETRAKLAHRVQPHAALEAKGRECGDDEARQPRAAVCGCPAPGVRVAVTALHGLLKPMPAALGTPRLRGTVSHALGGIVTQTLENPQAFVPKSHVSPVLRRVTALVAEFSPSAYTTDT
jgi:hypothetical protein